MANVQNNNTIYVDSTGQLTTRKNTVLKYIILTSAAAGDNLVLKDSDNSGDLKIDVKVDAADKTQVIDLDGSNIVFPNGIYASTVTAGLKATLIIKTGE